MRVMTPSSRLCSRTTNKTQSARQTYKQRNKNIYIMTLCNDFQNLLAGHTLSFQSVFYPHFKCTVHGGANAYAVSFVTIVTDVLQCGSYSTLYHRTRGSSSKSI